MGGTEARELERDTAVGHPMAQHVNRAPGVELIGQALPELRLRHRRVATMQSDEPVPLDGLRRADEREQIGRVNANDWIEG